MDLSVSILQPKRLPQFFSTPVDVIRLGVWSFTLLHLMFLVPEAGFYWTGWYVGPTLTTVLGGTLAFSACSLLPIVFFLEAWRASRSGMLNRKGLVLFAGVSLFATSLLGFGLPLLYMSVLYPNGYMALFPYLMILGGISAWAAMLRAQKVMVREAR